MGTPTIPPPICGDNCAGCDNVLWAPGETPKFPTIEVRDLEKCPNAPHDPPDGDYIMSQDSVNPCYWVYEDEEFRMALMVNAAWSGMEIIDFPGAGWYWFWARVGPCHTVFLNELVDCLPTHGAKNGTVTVLW